MTLVLEAAVLGILTGGVYALMASGLTLIFGVMRIINVGQGALVILGAYLSFVLFRTWHVDPFLSLIVTMPVMFALGVALQLIFIRPLTTDREALSVLVTYAIALGIEGILGYIFSTNYVQLRAWYETASFAIVDFHITYVYVFGFLLCLAILSALFLMLYRTTFGAAIRATTLNRTAAQLIGIDVDRVAALAFGFGMARAPAGGGVCGIRNRLGTGRGAGGAPDFRSRDGEHGGLHHHVRRAGHRLEHHGRLHGLHLAWPCGLLRLRRLHARAFPGAPGHPGGLSALPAGSGRRGA